MTTTLCVRLEKHGWSWAVFAADDFDEKMIDCGVLDSEETLDRLAAESDLVEDEATVDLAKRAFSTVVEDLPASQTLLVSNSKLPFEDRFDIAFSRLDAKLGGHNYTLLYDLRKALSDLSRDEFNRGLNDLRDARKYSLDSHDGRHVRLSPEQFEAGIEEGDRLLVYAARRDSF